MRIELIPHMDAGDRTVWTGDQDERPLSDLGRRQAKRLTDSLATARVDALFSSPALRCRETLQPLADQLGLPIELLPELAETHGFQPPPGWDTPFWSHFHRPVGGAYAAGRARSALCQIAALVPESRAIACSHGDIVPALITYLIGAYALPPVEPLARRGGWYTIELAGEFVQVITHPPLDDFPQ